ncbi:MAG: hypothetical protein PHR06_16155 [Candidatus Cloacimonetes bacterium]|nr:hypothetical protein [Candidatus Cloacimonadota bacterium]
MDKEAFLHQLESSTINNDKRLFAKTIYDLPADVIVGFTKEEFSRIIYMSHQFSTQKIDRLFNFLENKGLFFLNNALKGIDELNSSLLSKFYYSMCISIYETNKEKVKNALSNDAVACIKLAEMGIDSRKNLETAIDFYKAFREIFTEDRVEDYALSLINEGSARSKLAEMDIDSRENLETAINLYSGARKIIPEKSSYYASALMNEGTTRSTLAQMGIKRRENLETAVSLYSDARKLFSKTNSNYALALMNEGTTRSMLAEMGIKRRENLETAVSFYDDAKKIIPKKSTFYACVLENEGYVRAQLAELDINSKENQDRSKKLYLESISILEELGDGWSYSVALLSFNRLLRDDFYKTGDKKYLEKWGEYLGDIEVKINNRDIRYKEFVMARIHEIRANLLELDDKSGISEASFEYYEAYKLTKMSFYRFMKEFCQARVGNKSFCNLVSDWKDEEKDGIFLDYYDYTIFECHLENALKKSIFRKDELELARQKLEEISNRTQIKIVKDRVSAYIFLMNSIDFCFEQGSYEDAAENVRKACKIFHEFDDKPGCEMCECFHEALLENRNPESWRNVVQKLLLSGEFSSNFYRLLCNYSDKTRTRILQDLPLQIIKNTTEIKGTLDNLQKTSDQIRLDCISIKDQIGKGFKGTDAELKQINEKIDNSQQNLEFLVQISKDVGGKEGECIREFSSQILELMKKGDSEALKRFSEKIVQNSSSITEIIEAADIPEKEKAEAKSKLADLKKIPGVLKEKVKSFSVDVTKDVIVSLTSGEIIKLLTPVLSTAILGVPVPSQVVGILLEVIRNS